MSGLRPPKSRTPITSIAGLKKAISNVAWWVEDYDKIKNLIGEFEAGLRERLNGLEKMAKRGEYNDAVAAEELRRVLGEGGGPD